MSSAPSLRCASPAFSGDLLSSPTLSSPPSSPISSLRAAAAAAARRVTLSPLFASPNADAAARRRCRRLPNSLQPARWEKAEDAPWNPPTYLLQSRPGSQSHVLLESLPLRPLGSDRSPPGRWRTSASPMIAAALF